MKLIILAALTCTSVTYADIDYSHCNEVINNTFKIDATQYPFGFIQINSKGGIEAAPCSANPNDKNCSLKNIDVVATPQVYTVVQAAKGTKKPTEKTFKIFRQGDSITKITSGQDELQLAVSNNKCVAKALISDIPEENVREMAFDLVACKTFYEVDKKFGSKLSDCFAKDIETYRRSPVKSIFRIGTSCQVELKEVYKNMLSLKDNIISRYSSDKSLKRSPFQNITPPAVFNDQVVENFICAYEIAFVGPSQKKVCNTLDISEYTVPTDSSLGVILGNKKTCGLIYSETNLSDATIFRQESPDVLVYRLDEQSAVSGQGRRKNSGDGKNKASAE